MGNTEIERTIRERQRALHRAIGDEYQRIRRDVGLSLRSVSRGAGLHPSHLARVERAEREPSLDAMVAVATALGHEVSVRLYPSTGPRVHDRIQTQMIEALLATLHPRWRARLEVAVYRPVRGVIDVVLQDTVTRDLIAGEAHSLLHTVEQQVRWAGQKADALPSARGWPWADTLEVPHVGRLLLLRSTAATRELVRALPETFATAYPAATRDAYEALTSESKPWPGAAILWVDVHGRRSRVLQRPPRGVPQ